MAERERESDREKKRNREREREKERERERKLPHQGENFGREKFRGFLRFCRFFPMKCFPK